ncbi:MAG TPA: class I SAM-dependent methyltransferase [Solirubrobacterales bacterium]|nr:class I SAM-dependent methyltransferase [Solirubrobacterales bacterium]
MRTLPADPKIAELTASLPLETWAVDAQSLDRLVELVRAERPSAIVEFGSGTSTVALASLLAERHRDGPRLVSFEQDPARAEHIRAALAERGVDRMATVIQLEVGERADGPPGYAMTADAARLLNRLAPRLILVDGPTLDSGASRLGTLDLVAPHLRADATVLGSTTRCATPSCASRRHGSAVLTSWSTASDRPPRGCWRPRCRRRVAARASRLSCAGAWRPSAGGGMRVALDPHQTSRLHARRQQN